MWASEFGVDHFRYPFLVANMVGLGYEEHKD